MPGYSSSTPIIMRQGARPTTFTKCAFQRGAAHAGPPMADQQAVMTPDTLPGEPPADPRADAYKASRLAARATAEAALAAAVAHTARMEAAGYRLVGAVWVLEAGAGAGTAAEAAQREISGAGVAIDGRGA